jgi:formate dehydrogenase iron-sulfur subunit
VETLQAMGFKEAHLYGADQKGFLGGLNAFFLLLSKPATYNLPENPQVPQRNVVVDSLMSIGSAVVVGLGALLAFRERGRRNGGDDA